MIRPDKILTLINDKTALPIGMVIVLAYVIIWAVQKSDKIDAQAAQLVVVTAQQTEYNKTVQRIDKHLIRLEIINSAMARRMKIEPIHDDQQ